jgi:hypothetical protein
VKRIDAPPDFQSRGCCIDQFGSGSLSSYSRHAWLVTPMVGLERDQENPRRSTHLRPFPGRSPARKPTPTRQHGLRCGASGWLSFFTPRGLFSHPISTSETSLLLPSPNRTDDNPSPLATTLVSSDAGPRRTLRSKRADGLLPALTVPRPAAIRSLHAHQTLCPVVSASIGQLHFPGSSGAVILEETITNASGARF